MSVVAVIGGQWGDEGKGKIVDLLAEQADVVIRFSGGPNAGHTVVNPHGEFRLHLIPSGIFNDHALCIIGNGAVISPTVLLEELEMLQAHAINASRLVISKRAHVIMPYHVLIDKLEEEARGDAAIGTTLRGVGPAYADKAARLGIRVGDLLDKDNLHAKLRFVLEAKNRIFTKVYGASPLSAKEIHSEYREYGKRLAPFIRETGAIVHEALDAGKLILLEGAQGTLLDVDFGTYPYVTACPTTVGGACIGAGLSPTKIDRVLGVFKCYTTRVGNGPMPTELKDDAGEAIRQMGHEYGATTGRPRRCGWFDTVAARLSARINGYTGIVLTRLDILDTFPSIKICTSYNVDGKALTDFPSSTAILEKCTPVCEELPGWQCPTTSARRLEDLPPQAQAYVKRLEELIGCPVDFISVGMRREESIAIKPIA